MGRAEVLGEPLRLRKGALLRVARRERLELRERLLPLAPERGGSPQNFLKPPSAWAPLVFF